MCAASKTQCKKGAIEVTRKVQIHGKDRKKVKSVGSDDSLDVKEKKPKLVLIFHV